MTGKSPLMRLFACAAMMILGFQFGFTAAHAAGSGLVPAAVARKVLVENRSRLWKDPDSIRDARIGIPFRCAAGGGTCICIEANGRNSYGGFTGVTISLVEMNSPTEVHPIGPMLAPEACGKFSPFPEMNGKRR